MQEKIAIFSIIAKSNKAALKAVEVIHQHPDCVLGRLGLPVRQHDLSIICIALQAQTSVLLQISDQITDIADLKLSVLYS